MARITGTNFSQPRLINPPTLVEYKNLRFVIADAPSDNNLALYLKEFEKYNVVDVVRVCEPTYSKELLEKKNITVHDWSFPDGDAPPHTIVNSWMELVKKRFGKDNEVTNHSIAIHCVAGLGRAPVLVAIALVEYGMAPLDSVSFIRERRRGAINNKQLRYLETYKRRSKGEKCIIS
ncbi:phosphatases II [Basidiobolus meristosporus CBS 931.73]|uniref:protein-tyrosine-phosphatase n=1 Tax=Basidiobolus meristosporus CBS 931.73 TaxID=1314790 RepID=A0A1Y1XTY1_9FUNG|nr:phosphatases II [Basidiobolus meristosporus CBS 931.73]|eukprot:ORX88744.1 phosphatases II [Basidiobolus meristosporus CBS 931.73]